MATLQEWRGNSKHENQGISLPYFVPLILLEVELTVCFLPLKRRVLMEELSQEITLAPSS